MEGLRMSAIVLAPVAPAMPANLRKLIKQAQDEIKWYQGRPYDYSKEIAEQKARAHSLRSLWKQFGSTSLAQRMNAIVEETVQHYCADFYLYDLQFIAEHPAQRFGWLAGDCGTHFILLDGDEDCVKANREMRDALARTYGHYTCYTCNPVTGSVRLSSLDKLVFAITE